MKHGYSKHPLYFKLNQMKQRCYNKNHPLYNSYGAKGITVCKEWLENPVAFIEWSIENGYDEKHCSINRIDPKKSYCPENCNYLTPSENSMYHPIPTKRSDDETIIRSFYFRNQDEVVAVKNFIAQMRCNTPRITHKSEIKKALETCQPATQKIGVSVEDFLAKHPSKEPQETPEPQEKDWIGAVGMLPNWMLDVINGSFPSPPEENTAIQNKVFNDGEFQDVCKSYQKTHDPELFKVAISIAERLGVEL